MAVVGLWTRKIVTRMTFYSDMLKQPAEGTAPVDLPTQISYGGNKYLLWLVIKLSDLFITAV